MSESYDSALKIHKLCKKNKVKLFIITEINNGIQNLKKIISKKNWESLIILKEGAVRVYMLWEYI